MICLCGKESFLLLVLSARTKEGGKRRVEDHVISLLLHAARGACMCVCEREAQICYMLLVSYYEDISCCYREKTYQKEHLSLPFHSLIIVTRLLINNDSLWLSRKAEVDCIPQFLSLTFFFLTQAGEQKLLLPSPPLSGKRKRMSRSCLCAFCWYVADFLRCITCQRTKEDSKKMRRF